MRADWPEKPACEHGVFGTRSSHRRARAHARRGIPSFASRNRYSCLPCLGKERQTHRRTHGHLPQHREDSRAPHLLKAGHSLARRTGRPVVRPFHEIALGLDPFSHPTSTVLWHASITVTGIIPIYIRAGSHHCAEGSLHNVAARCHQRVLFRAVPVCFAKLPAFTPGPL